MGERPHSTVWLQTEPQPQAGCEGCGTTHDGPSCRAGLGGEPCLAPQFVGTATALGRVLASLRGVVEPERGGNLVDLHLVKSLRIEDGEAELTVTFPRGCGSAKLLAEGAFQAMRRLLPDTDIYVRHAA